MVLNALVVGALHLEAVHGVLRLGNVDLIIVSVRHGFFSLESIFSGGLTAQLVAASIVFGVILFLLLVNFVRCFERAQCYDRQQNSFLL